MKLAIVLNRDELSALPFAVIVECWGHHTLGLAKRRYEKMFTEAERVKIRQIYGLAHNWVLVGGFPEKYSFESKEFSLIQRVGAFFSGKTEDKLKAAIKERTGANDEFINNHIVFCGVK